LKRSSVLVAIVLFAIIAAVAGGLALRKRSMIAESANAPAFEPPSAVNIASARTIPWQPTSELVGTVVALRSVTLQNEVAGVVRAVSFQSGDIVEPGQVLVKLDDRTDLSELQSAEASLRVAKADVAVVETRIKLAESELKRQESAAQSRATSELEVDRARAEFERTSAELLRAKAAVDEAAAAVEQVKTRLDKLNIRAPFRAHVGLRTVHEGQFLNLQMGMESTPIATLQEVSDKIFIDFPIPQEQIARVRIGMTVSAVREGPTGPSLITLEVAAVDAVVNNTTRNVRVRAIVDNKDQNLRPGMFVKIRVPVEETREFVVVPLTAVRRASFADQVFVIEPTGEKSPEGFPVLRAHQRFVKLGPTVGNEVIILDGIKNDEQVAASGSFKLREGALVMPAAPAAGTAAAEAPAPTAAPAPAAEPAAPAPQTSSTGG